VAGEDDRCSGNRQQSPKDFFSRGDDHGFAPSRGPGKFSQIATSLHLPVDDAEYQLQVLSDARSPAAMQLLGCASAAQRTAGVG
jgi:hypothetical protein